MSTGAPPDRPFLGDRVVIELRALIASGGLGPGERIVERDIAERLGTSRGPVREAIKTLEHEGLVEVRPYAGAHVARIDRDEADEIVALRRQVEYFSVAGATLRATETEIAALQALADDMRPAFEQRDLHRLLGLDLAFHLGICEASHHPTLTVTMRTLYPRLAVLMYPAMFNGHAQHTAVTFQRAHYDLVDAIRGTDVEASLDAVDVHLDDFYTDVLLLIDGGRRRPSPEYVEQLRPARPIAVRRRLGKLD